jgi:TonB family protein
MILLIYIMKTVLISALLFGYYYLFLRNRSFHEYNRFFLLLVPALSFLLPLLRFELPAFWSHTFAGSPVRLLGVGRGSFEEAITVYASAGTSPALSGLVILGILSILISVLLGVHFIRTIRFLVHLRRNKRARYLPGATVYFVNEKGTPFSFLKNIFWGEELDIDSVTGDQILRHEIFHVKKNHSLDMLFMEINIVFCWFNPFFYMIRRELRTIHEYCADAYAIQGSDKFAYASLLLMNESHTTLSLPHPFFKNQIKRRITMITKNKNNKRALLSRLMILPMIATLTGLFSFNGASHFHRVNSKSVRVVIDAGHGGSFTGSQSGGLLEKNINLLIAKKIQSLAPGYNVEIIMSRETDVTPGSNDLHESLEYIAALPKNKDASLFISIHANATESAQQGKLQTAKSGFQIYIPKNNSEVYNGSLKLGSLISEVIKSDYTIEPELKQSKDDGTNILVLKKATVPAILIECGYMDNPNDQKYLQDEKNQEKIARDILEGIKKYNSQNTSYQAVPGITSSASAKESGTRTKEEVRVENANDNSIRIVSENQNGHISDQLSANDNTSENINNTAGDSSGPLRQVETIASYPGGSNGWRQYILNTLIYPQEAISNELQGDVIVEFVVNEDGSLTDIHVLSGPAPLRKESVRVVAASGKWIPAMDKGKKVASFVQQPIYYRLALK